MDPLVDPLTTHPIQPGWKFTIDSYPSWRFGFIDNMDRQFGTSLVWTWTRTQSDGPELLLTPVMRCLVVVHDECWAVLWSLTNKTSWTKKSQELKDIYLFFPPTCPYPFPSTFNALPTTSTLSTLRDLHKPTPHIWKHTRKPTKCCMFSLGPGLLHATVS